MASGDTALWLHNKLGSTDDLWSGRTICSQLSKERLLSILECFHTLQPHVKVKLMLSFLHILRRNTEMWKLEMDEILLMAMMDTDPWVCMVAEILQTFPLTGSLNTTLEENSQTFSEVLSDLKKNVKKSADVRMLPIECQFLNKTALTSAAGQPPQTIKHFALKRKPKSAILRAELLQKSSEAAANKKNNISNSVSIKSRSFAKKMDDSTPLRGFPGRVPTTPGARNVGGGFGRINNAPLSTPPLSNRAAATSARKEGKIKFLELTEVPVGSKEAKRRRRVAEIEAIEQQKKDKEAGILTSVTTATTVTTYTPDYAAGLVAPATPKMPTPIVVTSSTLTPAYVPAVSTRMVVQPVSTTPATVSVTLSAVGARQNLQQQLAQSQAKTQMVITQQGIQSQTVILQPQTTINQQASISSLQPAMVVSKVKETVVTLPPEGTSTSAVPGTAKKPFSLTRHQMSEAQEMFKVSNLVSRPEKALILGFMAGSRVNPSPETGPILNIRLGEDEEMVVQTNGVQKKMMVKTFFQMNYSTGDWKRGKMFQEKSNS